jgi:sugar phosphate permease
MKNSTQPRLQRVKWKTVQPTRVRLSIVLLALLVNLLCYTDRVCIAVAGPRIRDEFGLTPAQLGLVFSIFSLSYALGQAPWGALADRIGARGLVAVAILAWSAFTALTGLAWGFASLLVFRFAFGALEAALSPAIASGFSRWIPEQERSTAFGAYLGGGRLGGAITPPMAAALALAVGWRNMFAVFASLGLFAAAAWYWWYRHNPAEHPRVNKAELELISRGVRAPQPTEAVAWAPILKSRRLWCLIAVVFCSTFLWQFYITWFPTYLQEARGMGFQEASWFAGLPFLVGVAATWLGGLGTDWLARRVGVRRGRTLLGSVSLASAALLMLAGLLSPTPWLGATLMASAAFALDLYLGAAWTSAVDIGGRHGGAVAGLMNAASNAAGFASPTLMGLVLGAGHNWNLVLMAGVCATGVASVLWLGVNRER